MTAKRLISIAVILILLNISIFLGVNSFTNLNLLLSIFCSILLIMAIKNISGNYINMSLFFIAFSVLYGLSGPINALWGGGLHSIFSTPYFIDEFLIAYSIANIGFICGIVTYNLAGNKKQYDNEKNSSLEIVMKNSNKILNISFILTVIGAIFELVNFIRIGDFKVLFYGKAIYQELSSQLVITLPSETIMVIAFSFIGLYLGMFFYLNNEVPTRIKWKLLVIILLSSPFLLINILLGKRGILLSLFLCILVGATYFKPIKNLNLKFLVILLIVYVFLSFLYANRAIVSLIKENPSLFIERAFSKDRLIPALNPGGNEFGAAFGNFSEYYKKYGYNFEPKLGITYIKGLAVPIPSFVYPCNKPKQITYEFRDEFFPSEARRSSIAGTGFSSILEAYINFKYVGIFFVYFIVGYPC